jgi:hypothetical protein
LDNWVVDLHKQLDMKDKLIEALQLKLIERDIVFWSPSLFSLWEDKSSFGQMSKEEGYREKSVELYSFGSYFPYCN